MLSAEQRTRFDRTGLLRLPAAVPQTAVTAMCARFWEYLAAHHDLHEDRPETWTTLRRPAGLRPLSRSGAFAPMASGPVRQALDDLLGPDGWQPPGTWGLPLVTFPDPGGEWTPPNSGWHLDSHGADWALPGVTVFVMLTAVAPGGGGTAVLPGSHRWVNQYIAETGAWRPAEVKAALARQRPELARLWGRAGAAGPGAGAPLVRELTGEPGDVVLMHPRTLHAPAPNVRAVPRMMLVEIVGRRPAGG